VVFSKIIVGYDGSSHSDKALDLAIEIAKRFNSKIALIHVVPYTYVGKASEEDIRRGEGVLKKGVEKLKGAGIEYESRLVEGDPAEKMAEIASNEVYVVIIEGSRGLGGFKELLLGSVSHKLTHHAKCTVIITR